MVTVRPHCHRNNMWSLESAFSNNTRRLLYHWSFWNHCSHVVDRYMRHLELSCLTWRFLRSFLRWGFDNIWLRVSSHPTIMYSQYHLLSFTQGLGLFSLTASPSSQKIVCKCLVRHWQGVDEMRVLSIMHSKWDCPAIVSFIFCLSSDGYILGRQDLS